jgi:hypothetical protein
MHILSLLNGFCECGCCCLSHREKVVVVVGKFTLLILYECRVVCGGLLGMIVGTLVFLYWDPESQM